MPTKTAPVCPVAAGTFLCGGQWYVAGAIGLIEVKPSWGAKTGCVRAIVISGTDNEVKIFDIDDGSGVNVYTETLTTVNQNSLKINVGASVGAGRPAAPVTFLSTLQKNTDAYQTLKIEFSGPANNVTVSIFDWNPASPSP